MRHKCFNKRGDKATAACKENRMFRLLEKCSGGQSAIDWAASKLLKVSVWIQQRAKSDKYGPGSVGCWLWLQLKSSQRSQERGFGSVVGAQPACFCALWQIKPGKQQAPHESGRSAGSDASTESVAPWILESPLQNLSGGRMNQLTDLKPGTRPCAARLAVLWAWTRDKWMI